MQKKAIVVLAILAGILILISCKFLWKKHDYDLVDIKDISTDENYVNISYNQEKDIFDDDVLGILNIKAINLNATVKEGSTKETLEEYIGHISETSKYDGNIGLAAHNRQNKYSYFARINELKEGDIITYTTKFGTNEYKVKNKKVIYESDWSVLQEDGVDKITLITCIAEHRNQRLCVQAIKI